MKEKFAVHPIRCCISILCDTVRQWIISNDIHFEKWLFFHFISVSHLFFLGILSSELRSSYRMLLIKWSILLFSIILYICSPWISLWSLSLSPKSIIEVLCSTMSISWKRQSLLESNNSKKWENKTFSCDISQVFSVMNPLNCCSIVRHTVHLAINAILPCFPIVVH